jgi:hypothetical protein
MKRTDMNGARELLIWAIVCHHRDDLVGTTENTFYDYDYEEFLKFNNGVLPTVETIQEEVYWKVMNERRTYRGLTYTDDVRFAGTERIKEIIKDRVEADFNKNGYPWL